MITVKATDEDDGPNGEVSYHFKVGNENVQETEAFSINADTGELRTKIILDREVKAQYEVSADHLHESLQIWRRFSLKMEKSDHDLILYLIQYATIY